jgi:hypothetical protein
MSGLIRILDLGFGIKSRDHIGGSDSQHQSTLSYSVSCLDLCKEAGN